MKKKRKPENVKNQAVKNSKPLVTIFSPLYNKNQEHWIENWAEGLAKQTFLDKMKIVVIDNCSTDGGFEVICDCVKKYNLPAEIIQNEKNIGLWGSTKKFFRMLDTKYYAGLDPDDYYISPQKVEKAVKFLEEHEDYSGYACNQIYEFKNGENRTAVPREVPSQTFEDIRRTPFFQNTSITYRNYFTPEWLDKIEDFVGNDPRHAFDSDSFRWMIALKFGKIYFENSIDSNYRHDVGNAGTLSHFEYLINTMIIHIDFFKFFTKFFGADIIALYCANFVWNYYNQVVDNFGNLLKNIQGGGVVRVNKIFHEGVGDLDYVYKVLKDTREFLIEITGGK